eukprot:751321-Hanusia_phi.AAC.2
MPVCSGLEMVAMSACVVLGPNMGTASPPRLSSPRRILPDISRKRRRATLVTCPGSRCSFQAATRPP